MIDIPPSPLPSPLPQLGLLHIAGPDAVGFLQGQLSHDIRLLADGRTQLAAVNTPQGRVIALLRLRQTAGAIHALLPSELVERVVTHLRRYALRAKVTIEAPDDLRVGWIPAGAPADPPAGAAGYGVVFDYASDRRVLALSAAGWRTLLAREPDEDDAGHQARWMAADIGAGLPQVLAATSEAFVAQMLNLDLLDAISFSKGCYTGQEIVARTQHLGRIKRRTFRFRVSGGAPPPPLAGLFLEGAKAGDVLMSAQRDRTVELLAVTSLEARGRQLALEDGRIAEPVEMPYPVP